MSRDMRGNLIDLTIDSDSDDARSRQLDIRHGVRKTATQAASGIAPSHDVDIKSGSPVTHSPIPIGIAPDHRPRQPPAFVRVSRFHDGSLSIPVTGRPKQSTVSPSKNLHQQLITQFHERNNQHQINRRLDYSKRTTKKAVNHPIPNIDPVAQSRFSRSIVTPTPPDSIVQSRPASTESRHATHDAAIIPEASNNKETYTNNEAENHPGPSRLTGISTTHKTVTTIKRPVDTEDFTVNTSDASSSSSQRKGDLTIKKPETVPKVHDSNEDVPMNGAENVAKPISVSKLRAAKKAEVETESERETDAEPEIVAPITAKGRFDHDNMPNRTNRPRRFSSTSANEYGSDDSVRRSKRRKFETMTQRRHDLQYAQPTAPNLVLSSYCSPGTRFTYPFSTRGTLMRYRDIGGPCTMSSVHAQTLIRDSYLDTMIKPWRKWTGASRDIIRSAWAPDGLSFVVGASTDMDPRNQIYNQGNNLLWCDMLKHNIIELDAHKMPRPAPETGSTQALNMPDNILSPEIYTTISDICYGTNSDHFYTASYDKTVKVWERALSASGPTLKASINYTDQVNILVRCSIGIESTELLASAQQSTSNAVKVFQPLSTHQPMVIESDRAQKQGLLPYALTWGHSSSNTGHILAMGYGESDDEIGSRSRGDIILWNAETQSKLSDLQNKSQNVYDLAWHANASLLVGATSAKAFARQRHGEIQTNIRLWSPSETVSCLMDLDCMALDINRVLLHPFLSHYISVACTDGALYHYDTRNAREILGKFQHGMPIAQLHPERPREVDDFGIQFASWNAAGTLIYSGSSDGKIKQWNPGLNAEDAFVADIASLDAGISTGCFSPDFTNLLVGTTKGSMHVLSSAPVDNWQDEDLIGVEKSENSDNISFQLIPADHGG